MGHCEAILIVDDEQDFARGLTRLLSTRFKDLECITAFSGAQALEVLDKRPVSVMLSDLRMPGMSGQTLLEEALSKDPNMSVVMLTAHGTIETAVQAVKTGAYDFQTKPIDKDQLFLVVEKGLERNRLLTENIRLRQAVAKNRMSRVMIGQSASMTRLRETAAAVASSEYTVLVTGESGTGKELVARTIHTMSQRSKGPLVMVNCPAIPEQLLESELFGHVKGAFTGANRARRGLFVKARKGTIVLDEIGELSMEMQTKLLRVLQESEVRPVGSSDTLNVDVRVVASTNRDLSAQIAKGEFREDLYYRLNVLTVHVPPLRERMEDIPLLIHHFMEVTCKELDCSTKEIAPDALAWLSTQPWSGNIRELQNFIRRLMVFSSGNSITLGMIRTAMGNAEKQDEPCAGISRNGSIPAYHEAKAMVMDQFTKTYATRLLEQTSGNVSEAARQSGLARLSLQKILKRLDIDPASFKS